MILVTDAKIFIKFIQNLNPQNNLDKCLSLMNIFYNQENKIALTKNLISTIEYKLDSDPLLLDFFQTFITDLSDNSRSFTVDTVCEDDLELAFKTYSKVRDSDTTFILIKRIEGNIKPFESFLNHTCIYEKVSKPNKDWLIFNLLSNRSLTVRYLDFSGDAEIKSFFDNVFYLRNNSKEFIIFDSYCNLQNHNLFGSLKRKGFKIYVFTSSFKKSDFELSRLRSLIKDYFGKNNCSIKFSSDKKILHERLIAFDDIIVESNHDFAEIKRKNNNWKIDISINPTLKLEVNNKCLNYN